MIIVIGRGHSGTIVASRVLFQNGVATGTLNEWGDLVPPEAMYAAADQYVSLVEYEGDYRWNFSRANATERVPEAFEQKIYECLDPIMHLAEPRYFKLPEANLCYPWLIRMFPDAHYVYWVRDPRDARHHFSDTYANWLMEPKDTRPPLSPMYRPWPLYSESAPRARPTALLAAASWKLQYDLVKSVPTPKSFICIRYEEFCLHQARQLARLSEFLNMPLEALSDVETNSAYKWKRDPNHYTYPFLAPAIEELGYDRN